jgi:short-subunit dehydrogenase
LLAVTGLSTSIIRELARLTDEPISRIEGDHAWFDTGFHIPEAERFVLAAGLLVGKPIAQQSALEIENTLTVNLVSPMRICEKILGTNDRARICVIGSESGIFGSYDETYAAAKAGLHNYIQSRRILPSQQLVCVAPPIISDAGMTIRRDDYPEILTKRRTVTSQQVAIVIRQLLYGPPVSNRVERMC